MTQAASHVFFKHQKKGDSSEQETWRGKCSSGCYKAKTDKKKCKCKCRGEHHGKGQINKPDETKLTEFHEEQEL